MDYNYIRYGLRETLSQIRECATVEDAVALMEECVEDFEKTHGYGYEAMDYIAKWAVRYARRVEGELPTDKKALTTVLDAAVRCVRERLYNRERFCMLEAVTDIAQDMEWDWPSWLLDEVRENARSFAHQLLVERALDLLNAGDV